MTNKTIILISSIFLLSASCNFFKAPVAAGIAKTVNGGADWQFSNAIKDDKSLSLSGLNISKLDFDPQNHEIVYAGSFDGGLYKYESAANSWTKILSKIYVYDFAIHPFDSKIIYAAGIYGGKGRMLKTMDAGASWQDVYVDASDQNPVRAVALNPALPNQMAIGTESGSVIKSADGGQSWQLAKNFSDRVNRILWQSGGIYVMLKTKGLFRAQNFTDSFNELTASLTNPPEAGSYFITASPIESFSQVFVDFVSSGLIYITTNIGPYKTVDDGKTWTKVALPVKSGLSYARAIAVSRSSSNVVFTSVDSTVYKSVDGGNAWQTQSIATTGLINYILIDPVLPQIVYAGIYVQQ